METLTKAEESHVERMSESFKPTTMQEDFEGWASRVKSEEKKSAKEERVGPREVSLKGRSDEEKEWISKVAEKESDRERFLKSGELPAAKKTKSETESQQTGSDSDSGKQPEASAESQKPGADNRSTEAESEVPHFLDKGWTREAHEQ